MTLLWTGTDLSDEGYHSFGTMTFVSDLEVWVTNTTPRQRIIGNMEPRGIWQAGEVFLGWIETESYPSMFAWWFFIHHMQQDIYVPSTQFLPIVGDTVFWRLNPGVEILLRAYGS